MKRGSLEVYGTQEKDRCHGATLLDSTSRVHLNVRNPCLNLHDEIQVNLNNNLLSIGTQVGRDTKLVKNLTKGFVREAVEILDQVHKDSVAWVPIACSRLF